MKRVVVIGGGASGMAAAIRAAESGASVLLLEKKEQLGKKILLTGNGKCNYTNFYLTARNYRGTHPEFADPILRRVPPDRMIAFFESLGMLSVAKGTQLYPATERSETVVSVLKERLKELSVDVLVSTEALSVEKTPEGFLVNTEKGQFTADAVILATGSEASVRDPKPFRGYDFLAGFRHHVIAPRPALVPLHGNAGIEKLWHGVRLQTAVTFEDRTESGEVQFTDRGISGIPVFQLSSAVTGRLQDGAPVRVTLDFLPHYDEESLVGILKEASFQKTGRTVGKYLEGWLPRKLLQALNGVRPELFQKALALLPHDEVVETVRFLKHFPYEIVSSGDLSEAQVVSGGLDTSEVSETLESRRVPGLFVTGELLDLDGECGGFNLHLAFASGLIAGEEAAK